MLLINNLMNQKILLPALLIALSGAAIFGASLVKAQDSSTARGPALLIQNLAQKFNLKQDDVQQVFDSTRSQQREQMQANFEDRLSQDVANGDLTESQKQLILQKHSEISADHPQGSSEWQALSPEERQSQAESKQADLEKWASDNGIDLKYFFQGSRGFEDRGMMGRGMGKGIHLDD